jgi:hypothetical protein
MLYWVGRYPARVTGLEDNMFCPCKLLKTPIPVSVDPFPMLLNGPVILPTLVKELIVP